MTSDHAVPGFEAVVDTSFVIYVLRFAHYLKLVGIAEPQIRLLPITNEFTQYLGVVWHCT